MFDTVKPRSTQWALVECLELPFITRIGVGQRRRGFVGSDSVPRRKEVPFDPLGFQPRGTEVAVQACDTDLAALMQARPFVDPQPSRAALLPLRDTIEDAIDALTPLERWVFNACVVERKSIRALSTELSLAKSYIDRIKHRACRKLADALAHEPIIELYLQRGDRGRDESCERGDWRREGPEARAV